MFTSPEYWLLVIIVLVLHNTVPYKFQNLVLLLASYLLYAYVDLRSGWLLLVATGLTFYTAHQIISDPTNGRKWFLVGIIFNIGILVLFKVANAFVVAQPNAKDVFTTQTILPFGISFYSFRLLSYLFDVYNRKLIPTSSVLNFALYIAFFGQIASGPVERAGRFFPALEKHRQLTQEIFANGLVFIFVGLFYKIAIANFLTTVTNPSFTSLNTLSSATALSTMISYSVQLYADFAGYSLIAIGISMWFGLPAMENFRRPYFSSTITEFWTRWHVSLSSWFRDYLFYPLSRYLLRRLGNKRALLVQVISYMITMIVTGLWHGLNWTFVTWGVLFGLYMVIERIVQQPIFEDSARLVKTFNQACNIVITFLAVSAAWIFFRASTMSEALLFFEKLFQPIIPSHNGWWFVTFMPILLLLVGDLLLFHIPLEQFWALKLRWRVAIGAGLLTLIIILGGQALEPFVYSQF
jgi:alginate O-acetyltransferase complex protein AlgI